MQTKRAKCTREKPSVSSRLGSYQPNFVRGASIKSARKQTDLMPPAHSSPETNQQKQNIGVETL